MSKSWEERDQDYLWHPFSPLKGGREPIFIEKASGPYLYTADGRKILDAISSWWVSIHGHSHPRLVRAVAEQAAKMDHVIFADFTHEPGIALAEALLNRVLPAGYSKIFYSDNGSTAVEVGLKMAVQFWKNQGQEKIKIVALEGAYHGDTFGSMSLGGRGIFTKAFETLMFDVAFLPFPVKDGNNTLQALERLTKASKAGILVLEPLIQGAAGMRMYNPKVLDHMLGLASGAGWVSVADEVFTGFGRTGKMMAIDHIQQRPDIVAMAKGLSGGFMPLGATACNHRIEAAFMNPDREKTFFHGHSFTGHPMACAVGLESLKIYEEAGYAHRINEIASSHDAFVKSVTGLPGVKEARSCGVVLAIEMETKAGTTYFSEMRDKIYDFFLDHDILMRPLGNVLYIVPPYIISKEELKRIYDAITMYLQNVK